MSGKFEVGDKVRFTRYTIGSLYPQTAFQCPDMVGATAIVVAIRARDKWHDSYWLRVLDGKHKSEQRFVHAWDRDVQIELVEKGDGTAVEGVHYDITEEEKKRRRFDELEARVARHDFSHQGFRNAGTYLAWLYLNNERRFYDSLPSLRRKDGTINPIKVIKAFNDLRLKVDGWAFECPLDVPAEFAHWRMNALTLKTQIDWQEVADQFKGETNV